MNRRLQQFLAAENISQAQFAETIGVARASVSHILAGRNKPGFDFLESMIRHYPDLNFEWLLTGRGKMYERAKSASEAPVEANTPLPDSDENWLSGADETRQTALPLASSTKPDIYSDTKDSIEQTIVNQRSISKVIIFYSDGSFQELT